MKGFHSPASLRCLPARWYQALALCSPQTAPSCSSSAQQIPDAHPEKPDCRQRGPELCTKKTFLFHKIGWLRCRNKTGPIQRIRMKKSQHTYYLYRNTTVSRIQVLCRISTSTVKNKSPSGSFIFEVDRAKNNLRLF